MDTNFRNHPYSKTHIYLSILNSTFLFTPSQPTFLCDFFTLNTLSFSLFQSTYHSNRLIFFSKINLKCEWSHELGFSWLGDPMVSRTSMMDCGWPQEAMVCNFHRSKRRIQIFRSIDYSPYPWALKSSSCDRYYGCQRIMF